MDVSNEGNVISAGDRKKYKVECDGTTVVILRIDSYNYFMGHGHLKINEVERRERNSS